MGSEHFIRLTVVIPARNECEVLEQTLSALVRHLSNIEHEILVVNDHSEDSTCKIVEDFAKEHPRVRLVQNEDEGGFTNTLKCGFAQARGDAIVSFMADLCDDPATIPVMLAKFDEGYDVICASRYMSGGEKLGGRAIQSFFSRFVGLTIRVLAKIPTHDISNAFKMYRREVIQNMNIEEAGFASSMEIAVKAFVKGYRITEVPTRWRGRTKGKSKFRVLKVYKDYLRWYVWALLLRNWRC